MYVCMCVCLCLCLCLCLCMYVCMYLCIYVSMYVCMYVCVCVYVCMYACMHACMYVLDCPPYTNSHHNPDHKKKAQARWTQNAIEKLGWHILSVYQPTKKLGFSQHEPNSA